MVKCSLLAIAAATTPGDSDVIETQPGSSGGQAGSPAIPQTCLPGGVGPGGPPPEALATRLPRPTMIIRARPTTAIRAIPIPKKIGMTVPLFWRGLPVRASFPLYDMPLFARLLPGGAYFALLRFPLCDIVLSVPFSFVAIPGRCVSQLSAVSYVALSYSLHQKRIRNCGL